MKLDTFGAISITITVMISHIILNIPNHLINSTGSATLLNILYVFIIALIFLALMFKAIKLFPGYDIMDICEYVTDKKIKNIFCIIVCAYLLILSAFVIRIFAESLVMIYFPNVDLKVIILVFVSIVTILNLFGFKTITRTTSIILPIILFAMFVVFFSSSSNFVPERIFPILGYGVKETFVSGVLNIFAFSGIFILGLISPFIKNTKDFKKIGLISLLLYSAYLIFGVASLLFSIPSITDINNTLSIYILSRNVSLGDFIQRIDAIFILIWVMSIFCYLAIIMFFVLASFKKIINVKHDSLMLCIFSFILFIVANLPKNIADTTYFESTFYKYVSIIIVFVLCPVILFFAYLKKKREPKKGDFDIEKTY